MPHSDTICRIVFRPETARFRRRCQPHGNQLIPDAPSPPARTGSGAFFWRISASAIPGVLFLSPYAYQKANWLVPALPPAAAEDGKPSIAGLRDRAILSVGLQVGLRRAEIAALRVGDLHQNRGFDSLRVIRKGGRRDALANNPQTAARLRAYLDAAGHAGDADGPLFRPLHHNGKQRQARRAMHPDAIDRVVRKYAATIGLARGYSAHSMRATFITTALENGAQLEDVQKAAGHRDPATTKLYDRRGYNPEKAASFFATY